MEFVAGLNVTYFIMYLRSAIINRSSIPVHRCPGGGLIIYTHAHAHR